MVWFHRDCNVNMLTVKHVKSTVNRVQNVQNIVNHVQNVQFLSRSKEILNYVLLFLSLTVKPQEKKKK